MRFTRTLAALVVAAGLLVVLCTTAWAIDVDLTVKTSDDTNLVQLMYRVGSVDVTIDGADAETGATLDLNGLTAGATQTLLTTFGDYTFTVEAGGTITLPPGSPLTVSGSTLTIPNTVDLPDLEVRMRNDTGLSIVRLRPQMTRVHRPAGFINSMDIGSAVDLEGVDADAALDMPLLGLVPGSRISVLNNLGASIAFEVSSTGVVSQLAGTDVTLSFDTGYPDVMVLENTIDVSAFSIRTRYATSLFGVSYRIRDRYGPGYFTPVSTTNVTGAPAHPFWVSRSGATSATLPVTFDLTGMVPNQQILLDATWNGAWLRVTSTGSVVLQGTHPFLTVSGNALVFENDIDIQDFRIRSENTVNANGAVRFLPQVYPNWRGWVVQPNTYPTMSGATAPDGMSVPLTGLTPGLGLRCWSGIGTCHWRVLASGAMEVHPPFVGYETDGVLSTADDGDVTLTMLNSREIWLKLYGEDAGPSSMPRLSYRVNLFVGASAMDDAPRTNRDIDDFETGETFQLKSIGPQTRVATSILVYPADGSGLGRVEGRIWFDMHPDGTASFYDGFGNVPSNVSPTKGAVTIELDGEANTYYAEIVDPPNTAPTATLEDGDNLTILSSAQSTMSVTADVADTDGDDLLCSWYVDSVLVDGPSAPVLGESELDLDELADLGVGSHTIRVEVYDGTDTSSAELVLTVDNSPPDVAVGGGGVYELDIGEDVQLTAEVSDYDGDDLSYAWTTADGTVLVSDTVETTSGGSPASLSDWDVPTTSLGLGTHILTLTVEDEDNNVVETSVTVEVADTQGPVLGLDADTGMLWPPNHSMVEVEIDANAYDASGGSVTLDVTVESSEDPEFDGNGNFLPDYEILSINQSTGIITLDLRAERSGKGDGRVYTVTITATDASGNIATATVDVVCPHDKRK